MAMFDDPKKELERLEKQLLKEEQWFDKELETAKRLSGYAPAPKTRAVSGGRQMDQTQIYHNGASAPKTRQSRPAETPKKEKSTKGLVIFACLETLGIVGLVAYWLVVIL